MKTLLESIPAILFLLALIIYKHIPALIIEAINTLPLISFNPGDKNDGIYFATFVAIVSSGITAITYSINQRKIDKKQTLFFLAFLLLGGATLILKDPVYIIWKPTIVNLIFAGVFFGSIFIGKKLIVERLLGKAIDAPREVWLKLNTAWILFFTFLAAINLYVAYNFSQEFWAFFKAFGMMGLTFAFIVIQMVVLSRYISIKPEE